MRFKDALKSALSNFRRHGRMRSALTILGIVIGIASVIILMSIGQSAQDLIVNQIEGIGSNLIFIIPGGTNGKFQSPAASQGIVIKTLVQNDVNALSREPSISSVAPLVSGQASAIYGENNLDITYQGTTANLFQIRNYVVAKGLPFTDQDVAAYNHVVVIGSDLANTLFGPNMNPIGKSILLNSSSFRVVGVLQPMGVGPGGVNQDDLVLMPVTVAQNQMLGINYYQYVVVSANPNYNTSFVTSRIQSILEQDHSITNSSKDDFTIETQAQILSLLGTITSVMTYFLAAIASISLVVGGIGIMNIMLVSITERTKEIGLRKAVGATDRDILQQFLVEAIALTLVGGLVGIAAGALFTGLAYLILTHVVTGWVFDLPLSAVLLAVGVSTAIGLAFGIYPARQAARKSPIEALRYE
ncbi:MAG: ABC transporter permease [Patescibacteria group bacterium]|nr:ABC transporter permease [Patescibacteria group bacterium]MCL5224063.1 ABC transporter permease [Patescibacteria group bacterium]